MNNQQQHIRSDGTPSPDVPPVHRHSDGSPALTGPPSQPSPAPAGDPGRAELGVGYSDDVSDSGFAGTREQRAFFEATRGNPGPRGQAHELAGEATHTEPGDSLPAGVPAPID
jgi:hypothetical protein